MAEPSGYSSRAAAIRETVKWLAAVFAGTGAVLFSGLSFANLQNLASSPYWYLLVPLSAVPAFAAAWVVREAARIITWQPPDVGRILPRFAEAVLQRPVTTDSRLRARLEASLPPTVATYGGVSKYEDRLISAYNAVQRAAQALEETNNLDRRIGLEQAYTKLDGLQGGVQDLVSCSDFLGTSDEYDRRKSRFVIAAAAALAAIAGVAYINSRDEDRSAARDPSIAITEATRVRVYLPVGKVYALVGPAQCPLWDGRAATAVGGDFAEPLLVFDGVLPDQKKHPLTPDTTRRCSKPWTWDTKGAGVTILPTEQVR